MRRSFEQWRFAVDESVRKLAKEAYLDEAGTEAMYNCNYDPEVAAREWLRKKLEGRTP